MIILIDENNLFYRRLRSAVRKRRNHRPNIIAFRPRFPSLKMPNIQRKRSDPIPLTPIKKINTVPHTRTLKALQKAEPIRLMVDIHPRRRNKREIPKRELAIEIKLIVLQGLDTRFSTDGEKCRSRGT